MVHMILDIVEDLMNITVCCSMKCFFSGFGYTYLYVCEKLCGNIFDYQGGIVPNVSHSNWLGAVIMWKLGKTKQRRVIQRDAL